MPQRRVQKTSAYLTSNTKLARQAVAVVEVELVRLVCS
jgi:hypothetical protein